MIKLLKLKEKNYLLYPVLTTDTYLPANFISMYHIHPVYHMVFILDGKGSIEKDNMTVILNKGDILIINPLEKHIFKTNGHHLNYFTINFHLFSADFNLEKPLESCWSETQKFESLFEVNTKKSLICYNTEYKNAIENEIMYFKGNLEKFNKKYYINQCLDFVTGIIQKYFIENRVNHPDTCQDIIVRKISSYIHSSLDRKLDLKELSDILGYNPSYLSSHFSKKTNMTISMYHKIKRLEKACFYLKNTRMPITEIAMLLGFSSSQHFSRVFKEYKNVHPYEYRNNIEL